MIAAVAAGSLGGGVGDPVTFDWPIPTGEARISEGDVRSHAPGLPASWKLNQSCSEPHASGAWSFIFEFTPDPAPHDLADVVRIFCYAEPQEPHPKADCSSTREPVHLIPQKSGLVKIVGDLGGRSPRELVDEIERIFGIEYAVGAPRLSMIAIEANEIRIEWGDCFCPSEAFARPIDDGRHLEFIDKESTGSCFST